MLSLALILALILTSILALELSNGIRISICISISISISIVRGTTVNTLQSYKLCHNFYSSPSFSAALVKVSPLHSPTITLPDLDLVFVHVFLGCFPGLAIYPGCGAGNSEIHL